ncbi:MAG: ROK family transcriptional regulator [Clostridiales bacterium]|nr:ROK family transcriptional regulator [Clostridiales bacterium]
MFSGGGKSKTGSQQLIKETNIRRVFKLVSNYDGISRAQLANQTNLSPTTISSLAEELIGEGLIREAGTADLLTSGRKPIMLKVNSLGGCIAAVDLHENGYFIGLFDLKCKLLTEKLIELADYDELGISLVSSISKITEQKGYKQEHLLGICIGAPGIIDRENGLIVSSTILPIDSNNMFFKQLTEAYPAIEIKLVNESSLSAYTEMMYGKSTEGINNLIYIDIHTGIGAGIIINGSMYEGSNALAGEFGHISIDLNGPLCKCGSRGCLETLASIPALVAEVEGDTGFSEEITRAGTVDEKFKLIAEAYREHGGFSKEINAMARYISYGINNTINLINPGAVVIGGKAVELGEKFLKEIIRTLGAIGLDSNKETRILLSEFEGNPVTAGGAQHIFNILF